MRVNFQKIEVIANIAIVVVAIMIAVVFFDRYLSSKFDFKSEIKQVAKGNNVSLPTIDWAASDWTIVMALSQRCRYCSESIPFYRQLSQAQAQKSIKMIALFPQTDIEGQKYLSDAGIIVDHVTQVSLESLGIRGTPTLILVNKRGVVEEVWAGKLSGEREAEVIRKLQTLQG